MKTMILAMLALATSATFALTLKEQKQWKTWTDDLKSESTDAINKACGTTVTATMDQAMAAPFMAENRGLASICGDAFDAVRDVCEDETGKASIKKNVKKLECKNGKPDEVAFKLSGGTFTVTTGPKAGGHRAKAKDFLENNLK